jgi:hypothetical protein
MGVPYHRSWFDREVKPRSNRGTEEAAFWLGVVIVWSLILLAVIMHDVTAKL